jgi:DNA-binding CsgD family transcriptional regulator
MIDAGVLVAIAALLVADLIGDMRQLSLDHMLLEVAAIGFSLLGAARFAMRWVQARRALEHHVRDLRGHLRAASEDAARWRSEAQGALEGLGAAIERQCDRWGLTEAEREVALLLLKGLSMKEVADVRGTSERTARQQALAVYKKAGLGGRAELAAFFLEDLLLPSGRQPTA